MILLFHLPYYHLHRGGSFVALDTTISPCYSYQVVREIRFEWDGWNLQKNEQKHGVSRMEAESTFFDPAYRMFADQKHSTEREPRYILYGRSLENRILMIGFTLRGDKVRIITARSASRKEREIYGKEET